MTARAKPRAQGLNTYIALFRGINVGGKNLLPMKELVPVLEAIGLSNVRTYIQSGNVVFQCEASEKKPLAAAIMAALGRSHGFTPEVLILTLEDVRNAVAFNPFPEGTSDPKTLHLFFLSTAPRDPGIARLEAVRTDSERFRLIGSVFYLHAPDGVGRSRLARMIERALGVPATARNWRSVSRIIEMAADPGV
jgi:uncharacterized protein (DUF1697 family)